MNTTLRITGMTCNGCVKHVEAALRTVPGVAAVVVSLADNAAHVSHDPARSPIAGLIAAVEAEGYSATPAAPDPAP